MGHELQKKPKNNAKDCGKKIENAARGDGRGESESIRNNQISLIYPFDVIFTPESSCGESIKEENKRCRKN